MSNLFLAISGEWLNTAQISLLAASLLIAMVAGFLVGQRNWATRRIAVAKPPPNSQCSGGAIELAILTYFSDYLEQQMTKLEAVLIQAKQFYESVYENGIEGFFQTTPDGRYLSINPTLAQIQGYESPDEMMATVTDIASQLYVDPTRRAVFTRLMETCDALKEFESQVYCKNGSIIWVSENARAVRDAAGNCLLYYEGTSIDITERKRIEDEYRHAETALTASDARLTAVLDAVTAVISRFHVSRNFNFEYVYISPKSKDVFGYSPYDLMTDNRLWMSRVLPEDWDTVILPAFAELFAGHTVTTEYRFRHQDGSLRWIASTSTAEWSNTTRHWMVTCVETDVTQRKQVEIALKQSEAELQALFTSMKDVVLIFDRQGRYLKIPTTQTPLLYQPASDMLGKTIHDVLQPEVADTLVHTIQQVLDTQQTHDLEYSLDIDGQEVWFLGNVSPLSDNSVVWVARDISDRKAAEVELAEREAEFRAIFEQMAVGVDYVTLDGQILAVNQKYCDMLGHTEDELLHKHFAELTHPDDLGTYLVSSQQLIAGEIPFFSMQKRCRRKDGSYIWTELAVSLIRKATGEPKYILAVMQDITERKRAEEAVRQSEARFKALVQNSFDMIQMLDQQLTITYENPAVERILGYPPNLVPLEQVLPNIYPDDLLRVQTVLSHLLTKPGIPTKLNYRIQRLDGDWVWLESIVTNWLNDPGIGAIVANSRDITEYKQTEETLRQSEARNRAIISAIPDLLIQMDRDGRYLGVTKGSQVKLLNEEMLAVGINIYDILPFELAQERMGYVQKALQSGELQFYEYQIVVDGEVQDEEARVALVDDDEILVIVRDISDRKRAERALRQSESTNRAIVSAIPDMLIRMNNEGLYLDVIGTGNIKLLNPGCVTTGASVYDIFPADLADQWMEYIQRAVQTGQIQVYEYQVGVEDETLDEEVRIVAVGPDEVLVIVRDISDRKRAERALRQSESTNRAIVSAIPDMLIRMNNEGLYLDVIGIGNVKLLNADRVTAGGSVYDIFPADLARKRMEYVQRAVQTGQIQVYEYQVVVEGETLDEEVRIVPVGAAEVLTMVRDISDRKQAERALRQSETTNQAIIGAIPDLLIRISRDGKFLDIIENQSVKLYAPKQTLIDRNIFDVMPLAIAQQRMESMQRALQIGNMQICEQQIEIEGVVYDEEIRITAINDDELLIMVRNVTDRKQAERALRQSEATNQAIIRAIPDLLIRMNRDGTLLNIIENRDVRLLLPIDDQIGRNIFELMPFEIAQQRMIHAQQALETGNAQLYEQQIEIEGMVYDEEIRIIAIDNNEVLAIIRNVTDRKRAENALRQQIEREQAINRVIQTVRNSLDLESVFSTAVSEIGRLLQVDAAVIVKYEPDQQCWRHVAEYRTAQAGPKSIGLAIPDQGNPFADQLKQLRIVRVDDTDCCQDEANRALAERLPGSWLMVPLDTEDAIWGSLSIAKLQRSVWQDAEVELVRAVADQLAIAIQQSELYQQVQQLNTHLEYQVQERTTELQQALNFEALLKRITDKVRDSLDENQILQTAVNELGKGLRVECCNAALYNMKLSTVIIKHEYTVSQPFALGRAVRFADCPTPEVFEQLFQEQYSQFCFTVDTFIQPLDVIYAVLACPMFDDQGLLGDLWLYKQKQNYFTDLEIRLVQQVANQCAIALRQSRLYQAEQAQVQELERLNHLKDDFLSTVSHELRTPMSNIKMATHMLEVNLKYLGILEIEQSNSPHTESHTASSGEDRVKRYLQILREECYRETRLINDLLDLSRLDFGAESLTLNDLSLQHWIPQIAESFTDRVRNHQQQLSVEVPADLPPLTTDFNYLELILTELLHNACKYTPAGETITVSARVVEKRMENEDFSVSFDVSAQPNSAQSNEWRMENAPLSQFSIFNSPFSSLLQITVSNSGVEIASEELNRVFDKFYRVPNNDPWKHGGTGLGLALIKKRVERIRGTVKVDSRQGWTTFMVQLPWNIEGMG